MHVFKFGGKGGLLAHAVHYSAWSFEAMLQSTYTLSLGLCSSASRRMTAVTTTATSACVTMQRLRTELVGTHMVADWFAASSHSKRPGFTAADQSFLISALGCYR
eukprot:scaffold261755_cov17-Tisochrysis_lutea.AAC.1